MQTWLFYHSQDKAANPVKRLYIQQRSYKGFAIGVILSGARKVAYRRANPESNAKETCLRAVIFAYDLSTLQRMTKAPSFCIIQSGSHLARVTPGEPGVVSASIASG